jgi:ATP-dependent DNA helicase RecG
MIRADTELRFLKGVGPRRASLLADQGLETAEDLLYHLPFRHEDRRAFAAIAELEPGGAERTVSAHIATPRLIRTRRRGFTIFQAILSDSSGSIKGVWYNQPYLERVLVEGRRVVVFGGATQDRYGHTVLENPDYELLDEEDAEGIHTGRVVPVYRKAGDLSSRALRRLVFHALSDIDPRTLGEVVPAEIARRRGLLPRLEALRDAHFPPQDASLETLADRDTAAHGTLAFEEIFLLQLALALRRRGIREQPRGITYRIPDALRTRLGAMLPFKLTAAQKRVLKEIGADLRSSHPMHRLLQGDVGSGKTIVALLTLLVAVDNGYQAALMAPTEILAEQHDRNILRLLEQGGIECRTGLLTGSLRPAARRDVLTRVRSGDIQLVIGTHALFEAGVEFRRLGLAVVDEQHRFGVAQRAALAQKGERPDVLVMTATPIPRSLALTLYGDLDLSVIDELPPGRTPVHTVVRGESDREQVYRRLHREIEKGRQAYVVVPLVEETAKSDLKNATALAEDLQQRVFPRLRIGMVHGRMKGAEKDEVMRAFARGEIHVLVATTVIEVGVDVANATVMIIEHAERFGLSQLHQLRGRVGRGSARSHCVLMAGEESRGRDARERLSIMSRTTDGFRIAEKDLELRGPGAVFGTQQHGLSDLQFLTVILKGRRRAATRRRSSAEVPSRRARSSNRSGGAGRGGSTWCEWAEIQPAGFCIIFKNSSLVSFLEILSMSSSIASTTDICDRILRRIQTLFNRSLSISSSSLRVPERSLSMAGKTRRSTSLRSRWSSMLPVPLNSSKITSSMRDPVSINAVAMIVNEPPSSRLRAAPKNRFGRCNALASIPPDRTLPDGGCTVL